MSTKPWAVPCVTLNDTARSLGPPYFQPGLALRIAPANASGTGIRAISIDQNIWGSSTWIFWVLVWDSTNTSSPFTQVQSFNLHDIVRPGGVIQPPPWHLCARTVGLQLTFKLWTGSNPEPAWDDPDHVFTTTLPDGWDYPGYAGGYVAHLHPGQQVSYSGLTSTPVCLEPDMEPTQHCQDLFNEVTTTVPSTTVPAATTIPSTTQVPPTTATSVPSTSSTTVVSATTTAPS